MAEPLVSIIIPTYNRADLISETIENVFQQTYPNIEIIIVDDGSTDGTQSRLASYGGRIRWLAQKNAGPAAARNRGIEIARGEIIAFQDSDDAWHPSKIQRQVSLLERAGESVPCCLCNSTVNLPDGQVIRSFESVNVCPPLEEGIWLNVPEVVATRFILFNQAIAIRKKVLEKLGGFDESFRVLEDVDLELRLSLEGPWAFIREPLAIRQQKFAVTLSNETSQRVISENRLRICESFFRRLDDERRPGLRLLFERETNSARRQLRAVHLKGGHHWADAVRGRGLELLDHYYMAIIRRSPWFPKMQVVSLDSQVA